MLNRTLSLLFITFALGACDQPIDPDCSSTGDQQETSTGELVGEGSSSTTVDPTTGEPEICPPLEGTPWGPCNGGTCSLGAVNAFCHRDPLGTLCIPTCDAGCETTCGVPGVCQNDACTPYCEIDAHCLEGMVCVISSSMCVWPA